MTRRIRKAAPDGATHYSFTDGCYYNLDSNNQNPLVKCYVSHGRWLPLPEKLVRDTRHEWLDLREPPFLKTLFEIGCYMLALALVLYFCKTFGWV